MAIARVRVPNTNSQFSPTRHFLLGHRGSARTLTPEEGISRADVMELDVLAPPAAVGDGEAGASPDGGGTATGQEDDAVAAEASTLDSKQWGQAMGWAALAIIVGLGIGITALLKGTAGTYRVDSQFGAFAGLFVLALAVERLLEPLSAWIGTGSAKDNLDAAKAAATNNPENKSPKQLAETLARAKAGLDVRRQQAVLIHWGLAVGVSGIVAGSLNVLLMNAIAASGSAHPNRVVDLIITAFVVGAGTKPLHDLVSRLETKKNSAKEQAGETTATVTTSS